MLMTKAAVATYFRCFNMRLPPLWPRANQLAGGRRISLSPLIAHRRCDRNETDSFPAHAHAARQTSAHRISRWTHGRRSPAPGCTIARFPPFRLVLDERFGGIAITLVIAVCAPPTAPPQSSVLTCQSGCARASPLQKRRDTAGDGVRSRGTT